MSSFGVSPLELMAQDAMLQGLCYIDEFTYSAPFVGTTAVGASGTATATQTVSVQINSDADFIVQDWNITAFDNGAPPVIVANPNLLTTVTRGGAGRELMNNAQHVLNLFGGYQQNRVPGKKPLPGLWSMMLTVNVQLVNLSTTIFGRIDVAFTGFKVFYVQNAAGLTGTRQMVFHAL